MSKIFFKKNIILIALCLVADFAFATHYRAGEILFRKISRFNFEITVNTYTDQLQIAADPSTTSVQIDFGDFTNAIVNRNSSQILSAEIGYGIRKNTYTTTHNYLGSGTFRVFIFDRNRVDRIKNISGGDSENIPFCVTAVLVIDNGFTNQSPVLLSSPIDRGCLNRVFVHNPSAYDADGDSLVYEIRPPKFDANTDVPGFEIPSFTDSFSINQSTGLLTWQRPNKIGIYNIVIRVKEYRKDGRIKPFLVGYVDRDMQIRITDCKNFPPVISSLSDECVVAGNLIQKNVSATDTDNGQLVTLSAFGGPFVQKFSPAFTSPNTVIGNPTGFLFNWRPACTSIRADRFQADFKATDNGYPIPLIDLKSFKIKVIGPAPKNFTVNADSNGFKLNWSPDSCNFAFGYRIYRRIDSSFWNPSACQTGVPISTGFVLIDTVQGVNNTTYFDNIFGKGISPLINYCYRITSFYLARNDEGKIVDLAESSEGIASKEVCAIILQTKPIITNVSVLNTSATNGKILVKWLKPLLIDSLEFEPPYNVQVQRAEYGKSDFTTIGTPKIYNLFYQIANDSLIDSLVNTQNRQYNYQVVFYCTNKNGNLRYVNQSVAASSVFITPYNSNRSVTLSFNFDVPWLNSSYEVFRKNGPNFESLGTTTNLFYKDTGLINGQTYCYYVKSIGNYNIKYQLDTLFNNSQETCGVPIDTIPPCVPNLAYISPCNQFITNNIILNWSNPINCDKDVFQYKVYYRKTDKLNWTLLATTNANTLNYTDTNSFLKYSISGCYAVTAIDSTGNESDLNGNTFCIENCPYYVLPNVFTPNKDINNLNETFKPFPYRFIEKIELQVFNRWGEPVFETKNIDINWDGKDQKSGNDLAEGTYFYIIKIYENYLSGTVERKVRGTVTIMR